MRRRRRRRMTLFHMCAQAAALRLRLGELGALDITNASGRFMLNLSRAIDRFVALRLQVWCVVCLGV